ncbi:MAG: pyridoxal phosphate-dependent aminotransferase [Marinifilaceae bacterium]|nr:pyridoxal phosphate-dependent aminotransferase [Marinifilaceae bacterium]
MSKYNKPSGSYISYMSNLVKENGGINLAQGIPGFQPPIELLDILKDISHNDIHQYAPGVGNKKLKQELVKFYSKYKDFSADDFLITNGGTEAITIIFTYIMQLYNNKFSCLAFDPVYEVYNNLPKIFNKDFFSFSYNEDYSIDFEKLENTIKDNNIRLVFINTPGNPYGRFWTKEEFDKMIALSHKLDFYIILDAVYNELYFKEKPYLPMEKLDDRIFYINSFSKRLSVTGWRIGYFITHEKHRLALQQIHDYIGLCSPSILQEALAIYLNKYDFGNKYVENLRMRLNNAYTKLHNALIDMNFEIPSSKGGYFVWAKLPESYKNGFETTMDLYTQKKVAVIPGIHFSEKCNNYLRLNIAREDAEIDEAIKLMKEFFI